MKNRSFAASRLMLVATLAMASALRPADADTPLTAANGVVIVDKGLVGVGRIPAGQRDKYGETFGSGSSMVMDAAGWTRTGDVYRGAMLLLPDRGYNVEGTADYRARINRLAITFTPATASAGRSAEQLQSSVEARLEDTLLLADRAGLELTGLDPGAGVRPADGTLPMLPQASNGRISLDAEAIVRLPDGTMLISDEYGPNIYRISAEGRLMSATQPPPALRPLRKGVPHFGSNNPGPGERAPEPPNPEFGRQNNQGFEGLALTPDGRFVVALLQSATRQDGGDKPETRRYTRALVYDASDPANLRLVREHVVALPQFQDDKGQTRVAAQSELVALSDTLFLVLCRDSNNGYGTKGDTSRYRRIELMDLSPATNIAGTEFDGATPVAPGGVLAGGIVAAGLTPFIDINDADQLARFGLHNGKPNDRMNLSEKWESMALVSALDPANPDDYFLFVANDNDFITQDGFQVGTSYKDAGGVDVDTVFLVYRVALRMPAGR